MKRNTTSSEQQSYAVKLHHKERGEIGEGVLSFGPGRWADVRFKNSFSNVVTGGERIDLVKAVADNGRTYTLCRCRVHEYVLFADYVFEADIGAPEFDQIVVRYSEISEWFLHWQNIEGNVGERLTWTRTSKPMSVTVSAGEERFTLTSDYVGTRNVSGEETVLHEHVEFSFNTSGSAFGLPDLKSKTLELSCLLSILIAYPITIVSVHVGLKNGCFCQVHFPTPKRPERDMTDSGFWIKFFIQKPKIEDRWQTIFDHYYKSKYRKVCWQRLAGMQRYEGFWEYKALGYVGLLDSYVTIRSDDAVNPPNIRPSAWKLETFRRAVAEAVPSLSEIQFGELTEIASSVFAGGPRLAFSQKYERAIADTNPDVLRIISLSASDFRLIKRIRDKIAHGDDPGLREDEFEKVTSTIGKIALLLTYWAFLDFGLTTEDFATCLGRTHNDLRFSAQLDVVHLARVTGSAEFFAVTKEKLDQLMYTKEIGLFACFMREPDGELNFSEECVAKYKSWQTSHSQYSGPLQPKDIFGIDDDAVKFVAHGYFECGEQRLEVHHMWVIDRSQVDGQA
jgi:hypothetical protein